MAKVSTLTRVLVLSDLHAPHQDKRAIAVAKAFQKDFKPHVTLALGDWLDATQVSSFSPDIAEHDTLDEYEHGNELLDLFKPQVYFEGNHEERFFRQGNIPQGYRRLLDPKLWLNIEKRNIKWVKYSSNDKHIYRLGNLSFIHGFGFSKYSAGVAASRFGNVVFGHTHRQQLIQSPHVNNTTTGYNIGCLCDLNQDYVATRDPHGWSHGFGFGYILKSGAFSFYIVQLKGKQVVINGKVYAI